MWTLFSLKSIIIIIGYIVIYVIRYIDSEYK